MPGSVKVFQSNQESFPEFNRKFSSLITAGVFILPKSSKNLTLLGYKFNHLAINSTTAVTRKAGFTLTSVATAVVEFVVKWSNLCPTVNFLHLLWDAVFLIRYHGSLLFSPE